MIDKRTPYIFPLCELEKKVPRNNRAMGDHNGMDNGQSCNIEIKKGFCGIHVINEQLRLDGEEAFTNVVNNIASN